MTHYKTYPFTAIVGQESMKLALVLNAINPTIGGVLIKGKKGTAKSTAVRALADLLPDVQVIKGCPFNCNPDEPKEACHECQELVDSGRRRDDLIETRKMRVINLPINATEDRVVGTINIKRALADGTRSLEPGILAEANRNILYIDEVNLLADNVADVLLDSAAMGINIVEREGISMHHPARFILIGTMNPEEGNIRPQLLDRFGLSVDVEAITNIKERVEIVRNAESYHADPAGFATSFEVRQRELASRIQDAKTMLDRVVMPGELLEKIASICVAFEVDGHRADITINITAKTIAAYHGRTTVMEDDVRQAAKLALNHRLRRLPFEDKILDERKLDEVMDGDNQEEDGQSDPGNDSQQDESIVNTREAIFEANARHDASRVIDATKSRDVAPASGRVISHPTADSKGRYVRSARARPGNLPVGTDIAITPTVTNAALDPANRGPARDGKPITVRDEHVHVKERVGKSSHSIIFCVDASGSMGVQERMEAVKGAIYSILQSSYVRRDKVALVAFRQDRAEIVLPPTRSVDMAFKLLQDIPTGGTTPLAAGLLKALDLAREERTRHTGYFPLIVLLSDARGNIFFKDAEGDVLAIADQYTAEQVPLIVIDTEPAGIAIGFARQIAGRAGAPYHHVDKLTAGVIEDSLRAGGIIDPGEPA